MEIVLVEPEIPPNTGSIARLSAGMRLPLHLVKPLGFSLDDRYLKRAGLDYWPHVELHVHESWEAFLKQNGHKRLWFLSKKAEHVYTGVNYAEGDMLVFGPETRGLSAAQLAPFPKEQQLRIPIIGEIRSYNLSNAVSIVVFEALRQCRPELFSPPPAP